MPEPEPTDDVDLGRRRALALTAGLAAFGLVTGTVAWRDRWFRFGQGLPRSDGPHGPVPRSASPTVPGPLELVSASPGTVVMRWKPSFDDLAVTGYRLERDGAPFAALPGDTVGYADTRCVPGVAHTYRLVALDADGNEQPAANTVTAGVPRAIVFDDLEGGLEDWTLIGLDRQQETVHTGAWALGAATVDGRTAAVRRLDPTLAEASCQVLASYRSNAGGSITMLKVRNSADEPMCGIYVSPAGKVALRNDVTGENVIGQRNLEPGTWHALELSVKGGGEQRKVSVLVDGAPVGGLISLPQALGARDVGYLQLGELGRGKQYELFFDRVVVWT